MVAVDANNTSVSFSYDSPQPQEETQSQRPHKMGILSSFLVAAISHSNDGGGGEKVLWCMIK